MNKIEKKFSAGSVEATIWNNHVPGKWDNANYHTISLQRRYKDKNGDWKNTSSMRVTDLPKAELVIKKAFEFLTLRTDNTIREEVVC